MKRSLWWSAAFAVAFSALAVLFGGWLALRSSLQPAPFSYSGVVYPPESGQLCAGGVLRWSTTVTINRVPSEAQRHRYIRRRLDETRIWRDPATEDSGWLRPGTITSTQALTLPLTLAPGAYWLDSIFTSDNSQPIGYSVPFSIRDCRDLK